MAGVLRILLIIGIIWLVGRLFRLYVAPILMRKAAQKMQDNMQSRMEEMMRQAQQQQQDYREEGDVTIQRSGKKAGNRNLSDDAGEYVDFEEVD